MIKEEETKKLTSERIEEIEMLTFMANEFDNEVTMIVKYVDSELTEHFNKAIEESNTGLTNALKRIDKKLVGTTTINDIIKND